MANLNQKAQLFNGISQRTFAGMPPEQVNKILGDNKIKNLGGLQNTPTTTAPKEVKWGRDAQGNPVPIQ